MTIVEAIILGAIQGLTEFLPVSSSGHLVMGRELMGIRGDGDISFEMVLHAGTLLAVFVVMGRELLMPIRGAAGLFRPGAWKSTWRTSYEFRLCVMIAAATIPAGLVGLLLKRRIEVAFSDPTLTAKLFLVTAALLFVAAWIQKRRPAAAPGLSTRQAVLIGLAQAGAVFPGISRSGSTISAALASGVEAGTAGSFSFYLSVPVILGAILLEIPKIAASPEPIANLLIGFVVSFATGVLAFKWLLSMLRSGRIWYFGIYLIVVSLSYLFLFRRD